MSFLDHVDELRVRLMRSMGVFFGGFIFSYFVTNRYVLPFLKAPLFRILPEGQQKLYFTSLFENFLTHLKIAGYSSLFLLAPYFFWELWGFVSPGLYDREKKYVIPFVFLATLFFFGGAGFAYYVLFPTAFKFFVSFGFASDTPILTIDAYYSTVLKLLLLFGAAFELPVLLVLLGFLGIVDATLLRKNRRTAILIITVLSAMFAPPDAISMVLLMIPLIFLYEGAILVIARFGSRKKDPGTELAAPEKEDPLRGRSRR